ncbi:hypothetical protein JCM10449v2_004678 [Rhodotorula kratochvilovae]
MLLRAHRRLPAPRTARPLARRALCSSSVRLAVPPPDAPLAHPAHETGQLLGELRTLLDRYPLVDPAWTTRIDAAAADLARQRPARIAGELPLCGAQGLVSALLDDPLASNQDLTVALEARRLASDAPEVITIKHGDEAHAAPGEVQVPSTWLRDGDAEVVEIVHGDVVPLESSFSTLHLADLVVLVLSDSTLLSSKPAQALLYNLATKPNLLLALNTPDASPSASASPLRTLEHQLATLFPAASTPRTLTVSTTQALSALEALSPSEPDQKPAYDAFQKGYLASQIPHLHQLLTAALTATHAGLPAPTPLQVQTAAYVLSAALARAAFAGAQVADSLNEADAALAALEQHATEAERALLVALGVESSTGLLRVPGEEQRAALAALDELFATRLAWYKLPYRVDDLGAEIALVASQTFLPAFERRLAFSAGLAASTTSALSSRVDALFSSPLFAPRAAPSPAQALASLHSATTLNTLAQAARASAPSPAADASALSGSVSARRAQLAAPGGPAAALHQRAQRAVLRSGVFALSSVGAAAASEALGWAAQTGTSVGLGLLGVTLSAWGLQRSWLSSLKRFRADVGRVLGGVEEDLGVRARRVAQRAGWKAAVAVRLGREKVTERRAEWESARGVLASLEGRRRALVGEEDEGGARRVKA